LITTLGSQGSLIEQTTHNTSTSLSASPQPITYNIRSAKPKNTSDPTGAGDAYRAGFLAGFLRGFDLKVCGQMGSVAAAYTVEKYGTQTHKFSVKEFELRYEKNFQEKLNL
jgi:sugar/nucleoside kinase (ribokinase family)